MLGDDPPEASVPGEIVPGAEFYSYADKYEDDDAELLVPAPLTDDAGRRGAGARGAGRSRRAGARRWRGSTSSSSDADGRGFLVNEVNTIPGLHADLDVPAAVGGVGRAVLRAARPPHRPRHRPPRPPRRAAPAASASSVRPRLSV